MYSNFTHTYVSVIVLLHVCLDFVVVFVYSARNSKRLSPLESIHAPQAALKVCVLFTLLTVPQASPRTQCRVFGGGWGYSEDWVAG